MTAALTPTAAGSIRSRIVRDGVLSAAVLATLALWDFSGADLTLTRWFGNANGFPWRGHFITATLVHEGGRMAAWALLLGLLVCALRAPGWAGATAPATGPVAAGLGVGTETDLRPGERAGLTTSTTLPSSRERLYWFAVTLLCLLLVPLIKRYSATSCPYELVEFGGLAHSVSHWLWGVADGGPGHCFPSGHAVGAFAFMSQYFLWRPHQPQRARAWLVLVLAAGFIFGLGQLARGAHHASHSAWTAAICWLLCVLASAWKTTRAG